MLTRIRINKFKQLDDVDIELGRNVVFIGPNNSGKTTALQALALWDVGLRKWNEKRLGKSSPEKRPGVTINRNDLISIPIPSSNLLWKELHTRNIEKIDGKTQNQNIRIDIIVEGITNGKIWECGLEFDYANEESIYCRPLRLSRDKQSERMKIPNESTEVKIAYLPPMSGLAAIEPKWESGRISVLLGEGQTAQVLRNLCYQIYDNNITNSKWQELSKHIERLFGVILLPPNYIPERGEISMSYKDSNGIELDLSCSGRGLQQTILLLAYLYAHPGTVLLLDEPDAHLETLRQRQIYQLITDIAGKNNSQIIAASHSEVVLNDAAEKDIVIAFVGQPHRIDNRKSQLLKSLRDIGYDQYYQAEQTGWVLYLEGSTDMSILQTFARKLNHPAIECLEKPFVYYVSTNLPDKAREHFFGLQEAKKDLVGIAIFDQIDKELNKNTNLIELMWEKKEIENYVCSEKVLLEFARGNCENDLFGQAESEKRVKAMQEAIQEISQALYTIDELTPWSDDLKVTDKFLNPLFKSFYKALGLSNLMNKSDYYQLADLVSAEDINSEVIDKLDAIFDVARKARPRK